ncbi:FYVE, RhoGEF and PH domain-containing protein 6-like [Chanodichthys erythropterus]|uniref:FYVE, RhoGEF and PH domain-containing protein 6-like n=1 Tax=Chanodichthys erythropterus TaxID=933992 RepID=UPI00351E2CBF
MKRTGDQKPPLAPKPKVLPAPVQTEHPPAPMLCVYQHTSPAVKSKIKPDVAPKPIYKPPPPFDSKHLTSEEGHQPILQQKSDITKNVGVLNFRNGMHTGNIKPEWDYIIPICVCNGRNCADCSPKENNQNVNQHGNSLDPCKTGNAKSPKKSLSKSPPRTPEEEQHLVTPILSECISGHTSSNNNHFHPTEKPQRTSQIQNKEPLKAHPSGSEMQTTKKHQKNIVSSVKLSVDSGQTPESVKCQQTGSSVQCSPSPTKPLKKAPPVALPRKKKMAQPNVIHQESAGLTKSAFTVLPVDANNPDPLRRESPNEMITKGPQAIRIFKGTQCDSQGTPVPVPHQRIPKLQKNKTQEIGVQGTENKVQNLDVPPEVSSNTHPKKSSQKPRPDDHRQVNIGSTEPSADRLPKKTFKSPLRNDGRIDSTNPEGHPPLAFEGQIANQNQASYVPNKKTGLTLKPKTKSLSSADMRKPDGLKKISRRPDGQRHDNNGSTEPSADRLPKKTFKSPLRNDGHIDTTNPEGHPPLAFEGQIDNQNQASDVPNKKTGLTLKPKSKSLSSADMRKPDGLKKTSFLRIMDLDPVKKVPKLSVKSGQDLDLTPVINEQSVDTEESQNEICSHKLASLHSGHIDGNILVEQSVDEDLAKHLENSGESIHAYEDIPEYENLPPFSTSKAQDADDNQNQSTMYEDDDIYEIPDVFPEHWAHTEKQQFLKRNVLEEVQEMKEMHSKEDEWSSEEEDNTINREKQTEAKKTNIEHIVNEILSSEKIFVQVLKLLHVDFREAVLKASCQAGKAVIDERVVNQILCSLPQLYELNCNLLKELEERVAHWNKHCGVADIFVKKGPYLKMYSTYICEFDKNVALLEEHCRKNPAFAKAVREFESNPCCANLAVKHYMLKPIQRIPQYQLLLTDYLNNLDDESPDYKDAEAALVIVKEVANHANEFVRQEDNSQKLYEVQCRLIGNHVLVQPGRVLLKEGILMKLSRKGMQPRMFFLLNDSLLCTTPVAAGNFKLNQMLSLSEMKVSKPSQEGYQNELNIESVQRSFILSASSAACRDEWLQAISTAIDDYTKKETTFTTVRNPEMTTQDIVDTGDQLGNKAPIWIPDSRATMCMICTCEFTLTYRRHHCRACGKVVCQACSTNEHPLKYLKNHLARVCDLCFSILQQNSSGDQASSNMPLSPTSKSPGSFPFRKQKKIPAALKEVSANTDGSSMSGYLERTKANRKQWKRFWFVIMNKVLYTYAASEDVAALESQPLLGFSLRTEKPESSLHFKLYHKNTLYYIFRASDCQICERWIEAIQEATVL